MAAVRLAPRKAKCHSGIHFTEFGGLPRLVSVFGRYTSVRASSVLGLPMPGIRRRGVSIGPSRFRIRVIRRLKRQTRGVETKSIGPCISGVLGVAGSNEGLTLSRELVGPALPSFRKDGMGRYIEGICSV